MDWMNKNIDGLRDIAVEQPTWPEWIWDHQKARESQAIAAMRDKSAPIAIGTALGKLIWWGDLYAPEQGTELVLTVKDTSTHLLVLGETGSGKTDSVAKPFVEQWLIYGAGGLVLLDGKGPLPTEFIGLRDYVMIEPMVYDYENNRVKKEGSKVALIKGIPPGMVTETLIDVSGSNKNKGGNSAYFYDTAMNVGKTAEHLTYWLAFTENALLKDGKLTRARRWHWTIGDIARMVELMSSSAKDAEGHREIWRWLEVLKEFCPYYMHDDNLMDAIRYAEFTVVEQMKSEATFASVISTLQTTWFDPLLKSKEIGPWARTEESEIDILSPLRGGRLGIHIPPMYGVAGKFATALIRHRLWLELQKRGKDWEQENPEAKRVLFVMDEAQDLLNEGDMQILAKGRSMGAHLMALTQTLEGFEEQMGKEKCAVMLRNFRSYILLRSSVRSFEIIQEHIGVTHARQNGFGGVWGGLTRPLREFTMRQTQNPMNPHQYVVPIPQPSPWDRLLRRKVDLRETDSDEIRLGATNWQTGDGKEKPIVTLFDFQSITKEQGTALAVLNRAGAPRRDFVKLRYRPKIELDKL